MLNRLVLLSIFLISSNVLGQSLLKDPTRPANRVVLVDENAEGDFNADGEPLPGEGAKASFPKIKLAAIVVTEGSKYAIIDNEVVYEGQKWRNVLLSKIKPYSITLSLNEQIKEITINNNDFIKVSDENF